MMMRCRHALGGVRLIGKMLLSALMVCCLTDVACSDNKSDPAYDVTVRRLAQIPPGTVIGKTAPRGWSNLILKGYSRAGAGDLKQLSPMADKLARLLFTTIVADVRPQMEMGHIGENGDNGKHYKLAKVAVGLGLRIGDEDMVVTPDTERQLGANLGLLARVVLRKSQQKLNEITVVARSSTFVVFDSPAFMVVDNKHKPIVLRYALLVDERSGRLNTLVWSVLREEEGKYGDVLGNIQWLRPNMTGDCILHVDGDEFSLGQPTEKAFAITEPPKGQKEIKLSNDMRSLAARPRFSSSSAAELETKLREAIKQD